jgi:hypothetical protein
MCVQEALSVRQGLYMSPALMEAMHRHFVVLTQHKPPSRRWVSKDQYVLYFTLCAKLLSDDESRSDDELRELLEVRRGPSVAFCVAVGCQCRWDLCHSLVSPPRRASSDAALDAWCSVCVWRRPDPGVQLAPHHGVPVSLWCHRRSGRATARACLR